MSETVTEADDTAPLDAALRRLGLLDAGASARLTPLSGAIVSARSGESEDTTIVHLAVGWGASQLKVGSITRGERTAKWNEGLRIADALGGGGRLPDRKLFPWGGSR